MPVYGTCAGLILLADRITDGIEGQETFGGLDVTVQRNAFGGQVESFETDLDVPRARRAAGARRLHPRAARARRSARASRPSPASTTAAWSPSAIDTLLGTSFHPEVTGERRFHELFLDTVRAA